MLNIIAKSITSKRKFGINNMKNCKRVKKVIYNYELNESVQNSFKSEVPSFTLKKMILQSKLEIFNIYKTITLCAGLFFMKVNL